MYSVLETMDEGRKCVLIVLTSWLEDDRYYWPPGHKHKHYLLKKVLKNEKWPSFEFIQILSTGIGEFH